MSLLADEIGGRSHIEHQAIRTVDPRFQRADIEHGLLPQTPHQPRQEGHHGQQGQHDQAVADQALATRHRLAAGITQVGVRECARQHEDKACNKVVQQRDTGQPQRVVQQVEREQRYQPGEGDETPAFGLDALDQTINAPTRTAFDPGLYPSCGQITRHQKSQRRTERRARQVVQRSPDRTEQGASGQRQHRTGQEQHRGQRVQRDKQQRGNRTRVGHPCRQCGRIESVTIGKRHCNTADQDQHCERAGQASIHVHLPVPATIDD